MKPIILFDSNFVAHYVRHKINFLQYDGLPTNVIYGFLKEVMALSSKDSRFVFAWDSRQSIRRAKHPLYKNKEEMPEKTPVEKRVEEQDYEQFRTLQNEVLLNMGFRNVFMRTGLEGDDIIASVCQSYPDDEIKIVSADNDLWQLITPVHSMYNLKTKKTITAKSFQEEWGIEPQQWAQVKQLAGCTTDKVGGVPGVGNKTAVKYILGTLPKHYKTFEAIESKMGHEIVDENHFLVVLPLVGTPKFTLRDDVFRKDRIIEVFEKYGFGSFLAQEEKWFRRLGAK
jgi:5'-3' exonuclease